MAEKLFQAYPDKRPSIQAITAGGPSAGSRAFVIPT